MNTVLKQNVLVLASLLLLTACQTTRETLANIVRPFQINVDTLYKNGVVWTGVDGAEDATTFAVTNGVITFISSEHDKNIVAKKIVDLNGRFVMPGFMDNHVHFLEVDLRDASTPEIFSKRIAEFSSKLPENRWVLSGNWDHQLWGGELPHRDWIDESSKANPVYVIRLDGHMALANSLALKIAGIDANTPIPEGGEIVRDSAGRLTGLLKGNALNILLEAIPAPGEAEILESFELAQNHALSFGLTKVHALTGYPTETSMLDTFQLAQQQGLLKIRAFVSTPIESWQTTKTEVDALGYGDGLLSWGGIKGFVDGSLGASTAWMYQPYSDEPTKTGLPLNAPAQLQSWMIDADRAGLKLSIHAIGDKGIDSAIAAFEQIAGDQIAKKRFRIEHFQHPTPEAMDAVAKRNIVASMQPFHAIDDGRWAEERIGPQRIKTAYAFRSILDAGVPLSFGSDWPVAPLSPMLGVYAAVTRRTTDGLNPAGWQSQEKVTVEEALRAYTSGNAYADFEEDVAGTLEFTKRADFVVLSADPRKVKPENLDKIVVLSTVIGGQEAYRRE